VCNREYEELLSKPVGDMTLDDATRFIQSVLKMGGGIIRIRSMEDYYRIKDELETW